MDGRAAERLQPGSDRRSLEARDGGNEETTTGVKRAARHADEGDWHSR